MTRKIAEFTWICEILLASLLLATDSRATTWYAPANEYVKDHTIVQDENGVWHAFSISGREGTDWSSPGSEEFFSHFVSLDLQDWRFMGHVLGIHRNPEAWNQSKVWAPHVLRHGDTYYMFYTGVRLDNRHVESIGLATSRDLYSWREHGKNPVWECPDWGAGHATLRPCRDPMVFRDEKAGRWVMYYTTCFDNDPQRHAVGAAVSSDLLNWRDAGLVIRAEIKPYRYSPTESCYVIPWQGRYYAFLNGGYCVSDDPISGWSALRAYGPPGAQGFAGELVHVQGQWLRSVVGGKSQHYKLGVEAVVWDAEGVPGFAPFSGTAPQAPRPTGFVQAQGRNFWHRGKLFYPYGTYYQPLYSQPLHRDRDWFTDYDGKAVGRDLELMQAAGLNTVRIMAGQAWSFYHADQNWAEWPTPQASLKARLQSFLAECGRRGLFVQIFFNYSHRGATHGPIHLFDMVGDAGKRSQALAIYHKFISECGLAGDTNLLAYELDWEPHVGSQGKRQEPLARRLWQEWLVNQYGSVEAAVRRWGGARDSDKADVNADPPLDRELLADGPWTARCAAYRRFIEDCINRRQAYLHRTIRAADPQHLICSQRIYLGAVLERVARIAYPIRNTQHFLDYVGFTFTPYCTWTRHAPDWYAQHGDDLLREGFATALAASGKPVIFTEYGRDVLWHGQEPLADLEHREAAQREHLAWMQRVARDSGASGALAWWWQGQRPMHAEDGEVSDWGLLRPDGTARPGFELVKAQADVMKNQPPNRSTVFLPTDPYAHACEELGYAGGKAQYWKARQPGKFIECRSIWHEWTSEDVVRREKPDAAVVLAGLNGLFYAAELESGGRREELWPGRVVNIDAESNSRLHLTLANTGDAIWLAQRYCPGEQGAVRLELKVSGESIWVDLPHDVPAGRLLTLDPISLPKETRTAEVAVRLQVVGGGAFGERLVFSMR